MRIQPKGDQMKNLQLQDPLHKILEQHLFKSNFDGETSDEFINSVIADYLLYLDTQGMMVMGPMREIFVEDLREEIRDLTIKKTHGTLKAETRVNLTPSRPNRKVI